MARSAGLPKLGLVTLALLALGACSMGGLDLFGPSPNEPVANTATLPTLPLSAGESFGHGPVKVALLLPLTGPDATIGLSMANAAKLAIGFVETNPNIAENITVVIKDTGTGAQSAAQQATTALAEGASLILGPLRSDQVQAAGAVTRAAGIPLIGFSNSSSGAGSGVYLLSVLPEMEAKRGLAYAAAQGKKNFAALVPASEAGANYGSGFRVAMTGLGLAPRAMLSFANDAEAKAAVAQLAALVQGGQLDGLYLPDRASAPNIGFLLTQAGIGPGQLSIIGSAEWDGDTAIAQTVAFSGAIYPAIDEAGYLQLAAEYAQKFGGSPHRLATIAYTATILANAGPLSMAVPKYPSSALTASAGFNGRDGVFRILPDGRSEYGLVIRQISGGAAKTVDGVKI